MNIKLDREETTQAEQVPIIVIFPTQELPSLMALPDNSEGLSTMSLAYPVLKPLMSNSER